MRLLFSIALLLGFCVFVLPVQVHGQTTYDWFDTAPDNNWTQGASGARWTGGLFNNPPGNGILRFNNNHQLDMINNVGGIYEPHGIIFGEFNTDPRTISGNPIRLFDSGGAWPFIQNDSPQNHTFSISINGDGNDPLELRINEGGLIFDGSINNQGAFIDIVGSASASQAVEFNDVISGIGGLFINNINTTVRFSGSNTYTGSTIISTGNLELASVNTYPSSSPLELSGGNLQSTGFSNQLSTLNVTGTSSIIFSAGSHDIEFSNSSGQSWTGGDLTIQGWVGTPGATGSEGRIFIGTDENGLTQAQLSQISFDGYLGPAILLSTGELVPSAINASLFDDFNRTTLPTAVVGTPSSGGVDEWMEFESPPTQCTTGSFVEVNSNGQLELSLGTGGSCPATGDIKMASFNMSGKYSTVFQNAEGVLEWYFNFHIDDDTPSSQNRTAFVLGCDRANFREAGARGYAVAIGESSDDEFHLIRFNDGLPFSETTFTINNNSILNVVPSDIDAFHSIKVTYNPCSDEWTMVVRDDGGSFDNPTSISGFGSPVVDVTHVGIDLPFMGVYMRHTTSSPNSLFDNIYIPSVSDVIETYVWNGSPSNNDYQDPLNWTPQRTCTKRNDRVEFNLSGAIEVTNIPDEETIGQWILGNNTDLQIRDATIVSGTLTDTLSVVTLTGGVGEDLVIPAGATLRFDCGSTDSNDEIEIRLNSGVTADIDGTVIFQKDFATGSNPDHRLLATDPGAINVEGDIIAEEFSGNAFGDSGEEGVVVFENGSRYVQHTGSNPFGLGQPASRVVFNPESTFEYKGGSIPSMSGRTYGNFIYDVGISRIFSGGADYQVNDLDVLQGTLSFEIDATATITGDIHVAFGANLDFSPVSEQQITMNGALPARIYGTGNLVWSPNAELIVDKNNTGLSLTVEKDLEFFNDVRILDGEIQGTGSMLTFSQPNSEFQIDGEIVGTGVGVGNNLSLEINASPVRITGSSSGTCLFFGIDVLDGNTLIIDRTEVESQFDEFNIGVNSILQIDALGEAILSSSDAPQYAAGSELIYNSGGITQRGAEWSSTSGPGYPNTVTIQNGTEVQLTNSVSSDFGVSGDLNIGDASNGPGTLTMTNASNYLQVGGDVNIGDGTSSGTLTLSTISGGDLRLMGDWNNSSTGTFNPNGRAVFFIGNSQQRINSDGTTVEVFDKIILDNTYAGPGAALLLDGSFSELELRSTIAGNALEIFDGDIDLNGKDVFLGRNGNATGLLLGSETIQISSPLGSPANFNFEGNGDKIISASAGGSLLFNEEVTVTIASGVDFGPSTTTINATLEILPNGFADGNAPIYGPEGVLVYNTGSPYNRRVEWDGVDGSPGYPNDVIIKGNTLVTASGESSAFNLTALELRRDLTIESGSSLVMDFFGNGMLVPLVIGRNLALDGVLQGSDRVGGDIEISGDWIQTGEYFPNERRLAFVGTDSLQEYTAAGGDTLAFVLIDNPDGLQINNNIRVSRDFEFLNGVVVPETNQTLTFADDATVQSASNASYFDGVVIKEGDDDFTFPVGDSLVVFNDVTMQNDIFPIYQPFRMFGLSSPGTFEARYFAQENPNAGEYYDGNSNNPFDFHEISNCDYWVFDKILGSSDPQVGARFANPIPEYCNMVPEPLNVTLVSWNSLSWDPIGSIPNGNFIESSTAIDLPPNGGYGQITLSSNNQLNILPIELLSFSAKNIDDREVLLEWSTASETNNDFFTLERTLDGENFEIIGTVNGAGNSTSTLNYSFVDDNPYSGISYYRLKQTDFDGSFAFSELEAVEIQSDDRFNLNAVYASDGGVRLIYTSENPFLFVEVYDMTGQLVHKKRIENDGNTLLHPNIARGIYLLRLSNGNQMASEKFFY